MTGQSATDDEPAAETSTGPRESTKPIRSSRRTPSQRQTKVPVRVANTAADRDHVMAVIRELFSHGGPRNREPALQELAVALGAQRLGSRIRDALDNDLRMAVRRGILENSAGQLTLLCRSISEYTVNHLVATLMAAIGNNWSTRSEAVVVAARSLGFRRTGQSIQAAFKSVFNATIRRGLIERDGPDRIRKAR